jgi:hypothetical protein
LERTRLDCAAVLISRRVLIGAGGLVEKDTKKNQARRIALDKGTVVTMKVDATTSSLAPGARRVR